MLVVLSSFDLLCILFTTMILHPPRKMRVYVLVVLKIPVLLSMAFFSVVSITKGRQASKMILIVIWTLVPASQEAETYSTFITYIIKFLVNKPIICQKKKNIVIIVNWITKCPLLSVFNDTVSLVLFLIRLEIAVYCLSLVNILRVSANTSVLM